MNAMTTDTPRLSQVEKQSPVACSLSREGLYPSALRCANNVLNLRNWIGSVSCLDKKLEPERVEGGVSPVFTLRKGERACAAVYNSN